MATKIRITWYIRADKPRTRKAVMALISRGIWMVMKTSDGTWLLCSCRSMRLPRVRKIITGFLVDMKLGVQLYKQVGEGMPERFEDDQLRDARHQYVEYRIKKAEDK